jgi:hypothetical protein
MIKESVKIAMKNGLYYTLGKDRKLKKIKLRLGEIFSFLYDRIMEYYVFPG